MQNQKVTQSIPP